MKLIPHDQCMKDVANISRTQVCVRDMSTDFNENQSACSVDSGGPMMCGGNHDVITGVASFVATPNKKCTSVDAPNVYTRVAAYTGWIEGYTGDLRQHHS